jgi:predicted membrane protein
MNNFPKIPTWLIIFWLIVIFIPQLIAYTIWWFILFIGLNAWYISYKLSKTNKEKKNNEKEFIKFWEYKIYRGWK